jgi:gluconolactonase
MNDKSAKSPRIEVGDPAFRRVLSAGSSIRMVASGFQFTEGPAWFDAHQFLLFSDIPADTIYRWVEGQGHSVWRQPSRNSNGNTVDLQGRLLTCEHGSRTLTRTMDNGDVTVLAATYQGRKLNSPNDVVVKSDGTIWFTDPPYGISPEQKEQLANHVFRLDPGSSEPVAVVSDFTMPNGLCFSPDESLLYIADSDVSVHHIRRFRVRPGNALEGGEVFVTIEQGVPDGIRVDQAGRLFSTAADGVQVFSPEGVLLGTMKTPEVAANCTFGGPGHSTLFITATSTVWAVDLTTPGPWPSAGARY